VFHEKLVKIYTEKNILAVPANILAMLAIIVLFRLIFSHAGKYCAVPANIQPCWQILSCAEKYICHAGKYISPPGK
jgi:hypothetical protein